MKTLSTTIILAFVLTSVLSSCSKKIPFQISSVVPAAEGSVKVTKDRNKNYNIKVSLSNLADPTRLQPPRNVYVLWMETDNNQTRNLGQVKTSGSLFSKQLTSTFETSTPLKPTKIFITAEDDASVQYPMSQVVMATNKFD